MIQFMCMNEIMFSIMYNNTTHILYITHTCLASNYVYSYVERNNNNDYTYKLTISVNSHPTKLYLSKFLSCVKEQNLPVKNYVKG